MAKRALAIILIIAVLPFFILVNTVSADVYDFTYEVMPNEGRSTDKLFVWVRCDEYWLYSTEQAHLYIFWDSYPIVTRLGALGSGVAGEYFNGWDYPFTPPEHLALKDDHDIDIWVEYADGKLESRFYLYEITDGLPPTKWWKTLPQSLLNELRGEKGERGEQGARGVRGDTGAAGAQGVEGEKGEPGTQGLQGVRGETGDIGESGRTDYIRIGLLVVFISIILELIKFGIWGGKRANRKYYKGS